MPISKILVANRSEIAIRIFRAANELDIRTVAIWAEEDKYSLHRFKADESYPIGRGPHLPKDMGPIESYLSIDEVIRVAKLSGADAIHPGYGLLSESPEFADACAANGIVFIGPKPETMRRLGNKVAARNLAIEIGVPVVPATGPLPDDPEAIKALAADVGYPVMLKASWGGGGRGMRSIRSEARSRMLAWRFFGGGLIAFAVAGFVGLTIDALPLLLAHAVIFALAALLMILSSTFFVAAGEPPVPARKAGTATPTGITAFLRGGWQVLQDDTRFRLFLYSQWLGGATLMALPFYVVAAAGNGIGAADVGILLGAQTAGALLSNPLWGWLGDGAGKLAMLRMVAIVRMVPPFIAIWLIWAGAGLIGFALLFVLIGAMMNGVTIGYLGYLMEISPDDRRPAYSAYFNALAAPAALLPLLGAGFVALISIQAVFGAAILAALWQIYLLTRIARLSGDARP